MPTIDTLVIGAGQAGLAASRCLTDRGVDHVVLERGRVAERWRSERWDSLRLLTPNWMSRLPGWSYTGPDPHGFMTAAEVAAYFRAYADASAAPVVEDSAVVRVDRPTAASASPPRPTVGRPTTSSSPPGWCDQPAVPAIAGRLDPGITQVTPSAYRNPDSLPDGGVLVVGASATGVQLADELARAGPRRRARRRQPHPPAPPLPGHGHLLVARAHRQPRPHDRRGPRPGRRPPRTVAAARRPARPPQPRPRHPPAAGVELAGRLAAVDGSAPASPPTSPRPSPRPTPGCAACSADIDAHIERHRPHRRGPRPRTADPSPVADPPHASTCGRRASPQSSGRPATAAPTRGCTPGPRRPRRDPPTPRRHPRPGPVRARPALPAPPQLQLHRRRRPRRRVRRRPPHRAYRPVSPTLNEEPPMHH